MNIRRIMILGLVAVGCRQATPDLREHLNGWEYITTFTVLPKKTISIVDKESKIIAGNNDVLVVDVERKPIFKLGQEILDINSTISLLIQLYPSDSVVRPNHLGASRLYRRVVAFSPQYGVNEVKDDENIEITKAGPQRWKIKSDLTDFSFSGEFIFCDSSVVKTVYKEMYH